MCIRIDANIDNPNNINKNLANIQYQVQQPGIQYEEIGEIISIHSNEFEMLVNDVKIRMYILNDDENIFKVIKEKICPALCLSDDKIELSSISYSRIYELSSENKECFSNIIRGYDKKVAAILFEDDQNNILSSGITVIHNIENDSSKYHVSVNSEANGKLIIDICIKTDERITLNDINISKQRELILNEFSAVKKGLFNAD